MNNKVDFKPEDDGKTHINIFSRGLTDLGQWLSNFAHTPIEIPEHGDFNSIEGYWYWLLTKNEKFRHLYGYQAKKLGQGLHQEPVENFEKYIKKAIDIKIKSDEYRMEQLLESTLPFTHYYVFYGNKKEAGYEWIVNHIENRRKTLKEMRKKKLI